MRLSLGGKFLVDSEKQRGVLLVGTGHSLFLALDWHIDILDSLTAHQSSGHFGATNDIGLFTFSLAKSRTIMRWEVNLVTQLSLRSLDAFVSIRIDVVGATHGTGHILIELFREEFPAELRVRYALITNFSAFN